MWPQGYKERLLCLQIPQPWRKIGATVKNKNGGQSGQKRRGGRQDVCLSCYIVGAQSRLLFLCKLCCRVVVVVFGCSLDREQEVPVAVSVVPEEKSIPVSTGSLTPTCKHLRPCCNTPPSPPTSLPVFRAAAWTRPIKAWRCSWWPSASRTCQRFCSDPCRRTRKLPSFSNRRAQSRHSGALCPTVELFSGAQMFCYSFTQPFLARDAVPKVSAQCRAQDAGQINNGANKHIRFVRTIPVGTRKKQKYSNVLIYLKGKNVFFNATCRKTHTFSFGIFLLLNG